MQGDVCQGQCVTCTGQECKTDGTTVCTQIKIRQDRHPEQSVRDDTEVTLERSQNSVSVTSVHVQSGRPADAFRDRPAHRQTRGHRQTSWVGRQTDL